MSTSRIRPGHQSDNDQPPHGVAEIRPVGSEDHLGDLADDVAADGAADLAAEPVHPSDSPDPVRRFTVPRMDGLPGVQIVRTAGKQANDHRTGVVVTAPFGTGKTEGAHAFCSWFAAEQRTLWHANPKYRRVRVHYTHLLTHRTQRQVLIHLIEQALPGQPVRERGVGGKRKTEPDFRQELYRIYRAKNVGVLVIDEADRMSDAGREAIRDLIAEKELDPHRTVAGHSGAAETPAVGIGVVLLGTPDLEPLLYPTGETHGHGRWTFRHAVPALNETDMPRIYERIFPAFASHVAKVGRPEWTTFVLQHITVGRPLTIRMLTTHAREYFARLFDATRGAYPTREVAPFDRQIFLETVRAVLWEDAPRREAPPTNGAP